MEDWREKYFGKLKPHRRRGFAVPFWLVYLLVATAILSAKACVSI